jgi:hypothetical protein
VHLVAVRRAQCADVLLPAVLFRVVLRNQWLAAAAWVLIIGNLMAILNRDFLIALPLSLLILSMSAFFVPSLGLVSSDGRKLRGLRSPVDSGRLSPISLVFRQYNPEALPDRGARRLGFSSVDCRAPFVEARCV